MNHFLQNVWDYPEDYVVPAIVFFCVAVLGFFIFLGIYSSCRSASVYNEQHGTEWTCSDFLFAKDQINSQSQTINIK